MTKRAFVSFAEVKEKVPIPDALQCLGLLDQFQRVGQTLTGVCPLPAHHHGPSPNAEQFKINRKNGLWLWHCFGDCQRGGDVIELAKAITGFDDAHVRFWFAEHFGDRLTLTKPKQQTTSQNEKARDALHANDEAARARSNDLSKNLPDEAAKLKPLRFHLNVDRDVPYLHQRGLTPKTIERFGLGLCRRGYLNGYIAIPVYGWPHPEGANPLAYLGRWPGDDHDEAEGRPRYKWPEGFPKSHVVFGLNQALHGTDGRPLIVVEGPFKVFHLVQAGFPNAVATFGASLSDEQAAILAGTNRPIVLFFDGDEAGYSGMRSAAGKLITCSFVRAVKLPQGTEPDHLSPTELAQVLRGC